jgi:Na+/phosphate symporter
MLSSKLLKSLHYLQHHIKGISKNRTNKLIINYLLAVLTYSSMAIVIDGANGLGA